MPKELTVILRERYERNLPAPRDLVTGVDWGHPSRRLAELCRKADLPRVSANGLRRSCCTYLEECGASESVQALWLGHAPGSKVTRRHYRRVSPNLLRETIERIDAMTAGEPTRDTGT